MEAETSQQSRNVLPSGHPLKPVSHKSVSRSSVSSSSAASSSSSRNASERNVLPTVSPLLLRWFLAYAPRYMRGHFNKVRVSGAQELAALGDQPIIIYLNHPSWWDPMIAAILARRYFPQRAHYTPMDATALAKYKFFARLGFFGVEQNSAAGARTFLEVSRQIAGRLNTVLWITAQGRFADVRDRPVKLAAGLAHLWRYCPDAIIVPMAVEIVYGEERKPDVLVRFGECLSTAQCVTQAGAREVTRNAAAVLEQQLTRTMDQLAELAIKREYAGFETVLSSKAGVGGVYDLWRTVRARLRGSKFNAAHGSK